MGEILTDSTAQRSELLEVEAVLFDFEGTLVDFQWQLDPAVDECLAALEAVGYQRQWYGHAPNYASIYNDTLGFQAKATGLADTERAMAIIDAVYDKYDADAQTRWSLYPDTLDMLSTLENQGFPTGIVSNIGRKALQAAMNRLGLSGRLKVTVSRDDVEQLKPHAGGLVQAATALKVQPAQTIFIGDSRKDVIAARNAGMLAGFIVGGEDSRKALHESPADMEINRLGELPPRLMRKTSLSVQ